MTPSPPNKDWESARDRIAAARRHVAQMRSALLAASREEVEHQLPALDAAVHCLAGLKDNNPALRPPLAALRRELETVHRLIDHAAAFDQGLCRMLAAAMGGYTAAGSPPPIEPRTTISVKG